MPCCAEAALRPARGDRGDRDENQEAERRKKRDRIARRRSAHRTAAPCGTATSRPPAPTRIAGSDDDREWHAGCASRESRRAIEHAQVHDRGGEGDAGRLGARRLLAAEALGERLGDGGRAVGAADHAPWRWSRARSPNNAVGDITEERKAGDEHDHQPQLAAGSTRRAARSGRWAGTAAPRRR